MANEFVARKGLMIKEVLSGITETQILVQDVNGLVKYRTLLSLGGSSGVSGTAGSSGNSGTSDPDLYYDTATNTLFTPNIYLTGSTVTISNIQNVADNSTKLVLSGNILKQVTGVTSAITEKTFTWVVGYPAVGGVPGPQMKNTATATRVSSFVTASSGVTFNIERRAIPYTAGINLLSADQFATTSGVSSNSFGTSGTFQADEWLWLDIAAVSLNPGILTVTVSATG
jgi:hypothetical protein